MGRPTVVLELAGEHGLARDLVAGGVFVPGCTAKLDEECELIVRAPGGELAVAARVVWIDAGKGAGLQLLCDGEARRRLGELAGIAESDSESGSESGSESDSESGSESGSESDSDSGTASRKIPLNVHERLRGLNLAQQLKLAHTGETSERVVLERLYGKNVWDALLHNPRVTGPEVARLARMGSLPRPLVELIVGNGAWLQVPEVRRALLSNPRLAPDQILRVLRLLPRHELKLVPAQTAYPHPVREAARRILHDG